MGNCSTNAGVIQSISKNSRKQGGALKQLVLCRALNGHAWKVKGPTILLKGDVRKITLQCDRCDAIRTDKWRLNGAQLSRSYVLEDNYRDFLADHNQAGARAVILEETRTSGQSDSTNLRSLQSAHRVNRDSRAGGRMRLKKRSSA